MFDEEEILARRVLFTQRLDERTRRLEPEARQVLFIDHLDPADGLLQRAWVDDADLERFGKTVRLINSGASSEELTRLNRMRLAQHERPGDGEPEQAER